MWTTFLNYLFWACTADDSYNANEWNPNIISEVVRPPEQIKLVHGMEGIRSASSSSTSSGMLASCINAYVVDVLYFYTIGLQKLGQLKGQGSELLLVTLGFKPGHVIETCFQASH